MKISNERNGAKRLPIFYLNKPLWVAFPSKGYFQYDETCHQELLNERKQRFLPKAISVQRQYTSFF